MQHLRVLREADLVITEAAGPAADQPPQPGADRPIHERWVSHYEENWVAALVGLRGAVEARGGTPS